MERKGIALVGNILTDNVKFVQSYPEKGMLATITSESLAVGGCVPNTGIDIAKLDPELPVSAYGRVGKDFKGEFVVDQMKKVGINTDGVTVSEKEPTSYSDVITVSGTGERTFFHNRGANKEFSPEHVCLEKINAKILHAGYLMLLDSFDKIFEDGSTPMSRMLEMAQKLGIKTSIDIVSESSGNFFKVTKASLPHCDYVIINEIEGGAIVGVEPRDKDGKLIEENIPVILKKLMDLGIKEKVIVHCPEIGYCLDKSGKLTAVPSVKLPKGFIKGSVGAGDAFCAGCLYAIYNDYSDEETLSFANLVAINCLSEADSISGIKHKDKIKDVIKNF
ncbi:MAG: carbohydrate kinase family protein [Clostridiales bacterium]|nr:carbohydrate kinase family protein [Clostridiales bacterium]